MPNLDRINDIKNRAIERYQATDTGVLVSHLVDLTLILETENGLETLLVTPKVRIKQLDQRLVGKTVGTLVLDATDWQVSHINRLIATPEQLTRGIHEVQFSLSDGGNERCRMVYLDYSRLTQYSMIVRRLEDMYS